MIYLELDVVALSGDVNTVGHHGHLAEQGQLVLRQQACGDGAAAYVLCACGMVVYPCTEASNMPSCHYFVAFWWTSLL